MWALREIRSKAIKVLSHKNDNNNEISFFDVKELYEAAYAEKAKVKFSLKKFEMLLSKAMKLDQAYRIKLATDKMAKHKIKQYRRVA